MNDPKEQSGIILYLIMKKFFLKQHKSFFSAALIFCTSVALAQSPQRAKCLEKYHPSTPKKPLQALAAKSTTISKPLRSANHVWNNGWVFIDSSQYSYTAVGWLAEELRKSNAPVTRTTYTYDAQNRLTQKRTENWDASSSQWKNANRQSYVYNAQGDLTEDIYEVYSANVWQIQMASQYIYTYDASNHLIDYISQNWNTASQSWIDFHHQTGFSYDASGNCTQYEEQFKLGANWVNMDRFSYTYVNNEPVDVLTEHWNGTAYVNAERMVNITWHVWDGINSAQTAITSCTIQNWVSNTWLPWDRVNVAYDNYGGSVEIDQSYNGSTWDNTYRIKTNYDQQSNYTGNSLELWSAPVWDLYSEDKIINTYDADFNFTQQIWQYWDDFASQMINVEKRVYDGYQIYAGMDERDYSDHIRVYPNPCSEYVEFSFDDKSLSGAEDMKLLLFDQNGRMLKETTFNVFHSRLSLEQVSPGLYFYELRSLGKSLKKEKLLVE